MGQVLPWIATRLKYDRIKLSLAVETHPEVLSNSYVRHARMAVKVASPPAQVQGLTCVSDMVGMLEPPRCEPAASK